LRISARRDNAELPARGSLPLTATHGCRFSKGLRSWKALRDMADRSAANPEKRQRRFDLKGPADAYAR
jgi:hypothetical protein